VLGRVMELQATQDATRLLRLERLVERGGSIARSARS
jgi:hypothetical protein